MRLQLRVKNIYSEIHPTIFLTPYSLFEVTGLEPIPATVEQRCVTPWTGCQAVAGGIQIYNTDFVENVVQNISPWPPVAVFE